MSRPFFLRYWGLSVKYCFVDLRMGAIRSKTLRTSYHPKGMDTNAGAKVSPPLVLSPFPLPMLDPRSVRLRLTIRFVCGNRSFRQLRRRWCTFARLRLYSIFYEVENIDVIEKAVTLMRSLGSRAEAEEPERGGPRLPRALFFEALCKHSMSECVYIAIFDLIVYRKSRLNLLRKL